jgi:hypothetical protein
MKKIISLVLLSIFFFNSSYAEKYWSNIKDNPTNIEEAESYIYQKYLNITPSDERTEFHPLFGIWYNHNLGFVGIYEESFKSDIFKMILIKAPIGFGASKFPGYEPEKYYKTHRDHEGTIEATIIGDGGDYITHNKFWYEQDDGSYKYKNKLGKIKLLSNDHFESEIPDEEKDIFIRITSRLKKIIKKIDSSKKISDFEIETSRGIFIYFDTKVEDEIIIDKFINISFNGDVSAGKIYRGLKERHKNGIDRIVCLDKNSDESGLAFHMYFNKGDYLGREKGNIKPKLIKKNCDPLKVSYSTYMHYKNKNYYWTGGIVLSLIVIFFFLKIQRIRELSAHNRNNKNKFETYSELKEYKKKIEDKESLKQAAKEEKERKAEEAKLAREAKAEERRLEKEEKRKENTEYKESKDDYDDFLMDKVKRLKRLYKSGTLSKAEFEKAKNKLLK